MNNYNYFDMYDVICINGNDDPFGINDVLLKMVELLDEKCDLISEEDTGEPILIDFTALSDEEMSELIREAALCVEFENDVHACDANETERPYLLS